MGIEILGFNFNSKTAIYAKDLQKAGFKVLWDGNKRQVNIISQSISERAISIGEVLYSDEIIIETPAKTNESLVWNQPALIG